MKKLLIAFLMILALTLQVSAGSSPVRDEADLLTDQEEDALAKQAQELIDSQNTDIVILTVDSLDGKTPAAYANDYFDTNSLGIGSTRSGILMLVSMEERDWYILTNGYADDCISYSDLGAMEDDFLEYLSDGEYYRGFMTALHGFDRELSKGPGGMHWIFKVLIALLIGAAAAAITLLIMRSRMNTLKPQMGARNYLEHGGYDLWQCQDLFLYSHITKTRRPASKSTGRSGSRSRGGRGGKF